MKYLWLIAALWVPQYAVAQTDDVRATWEADRATVFAADDIALEELRWIARVVVVFADSPLDTAYQTQLDLLAQGAEDLAERDVIVLVDTDPAAKGALRTKLRARGFTMILLGKDGGVKLRKPFPWDVRELSRSIDKMPMRQREIIERRAIMAAPASE